MEDLLGLIVWFFIIAASISSKNKKKAKKQTGSARSNPWDEVLQNIPGQSGEVLRQLTQASKPAPARPAPAQMSMPLPSTADMPAGTFAPLAPMAPTVHTHLEPACETHDVPGSLGHVSTEGVDVCHEQQFAPRTESTPIPMEQPGLRLKLDSDSLVQAFVLQEVLTRPCDRRPRGYAR